MRSAFLQAPEIARRILVIRSQRVIIDSDLAALYGVSTKRLNEQIKRNARRFPRDFLFRLTPIERDEVVANCDHLAKLRFSPTMPYALTEHGALMAASVLNTVRKTPADWLRYAQGVTSFTGKSSARRRPR